jgi:hypothetical protein
MDNRYIQKEENKKLRQQENQQNDEGLCLWLNSPRFQIPILQASTSAKTPP